MKASNMMNSSCILNIVIVTLKYKSIHWEIQLTINFSNISFFIRKCKWGQLTSKDKVHIMEQNKAVLAKETMRW